MNEKISYKDIFCQKEYLKMIIAAMINRFGDSVDAIASSWIVYEITENAAWSAIIFALNKIPTILVTPFAGAWVEGRKKKTIMVVTDLIRAFCVAIVASGYLFDFLQPWILVLTTLTISTAEAFRGPANTALTPKLLEEKYYEYGMSLKSTLSTIVELIGTAMAAGIIAIIGTAGAIYIDMITFILSAVIIMAVNTKEQGLQHQNFNAKEYMATFHEGLVYVKKDNLIKFFICICVFLNAMLVPFNSLQAPLTNEVLHGGAEVLSILGISLTVGMLAGSAFYPMFCKLLSSKYIVFWGGAGIGIYYLGLILCAPFYSNKYFMYVFVAVASTLFGIFATMLLAFIQVEFVRRVRETYLARTGAIMDAIGSAATPLVGFLISAIAVFVKTEWIFAAAGILDFVVCLFILRSKVLDEQKEASEVSVEATTVE